MADKLIKNLTDLAPEVRAYIYQQMADFQPFFLHDSNMGVEIKEVSEEEEVSYTVTLTLTGGGTYVQSEAEGKDIYEATSKAKEDLLKHLFEVLQRLKTVGAVEEHEASGTLEDVKILH